jgi:hypothetical protein
MWNAARVLQVGLMVAVAAGLFALLFSTFGDFSKPTCADGWQSSSIGRQGACSWHGGVRHPDNTRLILVSAILSALAALIVGVIYAAIVSRYLPAPPPPAPPREPDPTCPKCKGTMLLRRGPRGEFWGCGRYPRCRGTRAIVAPRRTPA